MAEYDDLVRRAAEAVRSAGSMCVCENDDLNLERVTEVLAPFFAAARKEAREGALEEQTNMRRALTEAICLASDLGYPTSARRWQSVLDGGALRSKPKEPA